MTTSTETTFNIDRLMTELREATKAEGFICVFFSREGEEEGGEALRTTTIFENTSGDIAGFLIYKLMKEVTSTIMAGKFPLDNPPILSWLLGGLHNPPFESTPNDRQVLIDTRDDPSTLN